MPIELTGLESRPLLSTIIPPLSYHIYFIMCSSLLHSSFTLLFSSNKSYILLIMLSYLSANDIWLKLQQICCVVVNKSHTEVGINYSI